MIETTAMPAAHSLPSRLSRSECMDMFHELDIPKKQLFQLFYGNMSSRTRRISRWKNSGILGNSEQFAFWLLSQFDAEDQHELLREWVAKECKEENEHE